MKQINNWFINVRRRHLYNGERSTLLGDAVNLFAINNISIGDVKEGGTGGGDDNENDDDHDGDGDADGDGYGDAGVGA